MRDHAHASEDLGMITGLLSLGIQFDSVRGYSRSNRWVKAHGYRESTRKRSYRIVPSGPDAKRAKLV
jgi:hypothetical protein